MMSKDRTKDNGHKTEHRRFCLNIRKCFFTVHMIEQWYRLPREVLEFPTLEIFISHQHSPRQLALGVFAWAGILDKKTSRGPQQPQLFCDSVKLSYIESHMKRCTFKVKDYAQGIKVFTSLIKSFSLKLFDSQVWPMSDLCEMFSYVHRKRYVILEFFCLFLFYKLHMQCGTAQACAGW